MWLEDRDELDGYNSVNTISKAINILLTAAITQKVYKQIHIFCFILIVYINFRSIFNQLDFFLMMYFFLTVQIRKIHEHIKDLRLIDNLYHTGPHLLIIIVEISHSYRPTADYSPDRSGEIAVQWDAIEKGFADDKAEKMDYLHFVLIFRGYLRLLLDESVGSLGGIAKLEYIVNLGVEYFKHAKMHPLPQNSSCIIHLFIINAYLQLFPQIHTRQALQARHQEIIPIDLEQFASKLPGNPYLLHINPQPCQFLLHTQFLDHTDRVVDDIGRKDNERLIDYDKLCILQIRRDFYRYCLLLDDKKIGAISSSQICWVEILLLHAKQWVWNWSLLFGSWGLIHNDLRDRMG